MGSRTSQVAKLFRQKYWHGMPAFFRSSSNASFFNPTSRRVLRSETTSERILGFNSWTISGWSRFHCLRNIGHTCPPCPFRSRLVPSARLSTALDFFALAELGCLGCLSQLEPATKANSTLLSSSVLPSCCLWFLPLWGYFE